MAPMNIMKRKNIAFLGILSMFLCKNMGASQGLIANSGTFPNFPLEYSVNISNADHSVKMSFRIRNGSQQSLFLSDLNLPWVHAQTLSITLHSSNLVFKPKTPGWKTDYKATTNIFRKFVELRAGEEIGGDYLINEDYDKILDGRVVGDVGINWCLLLECYSKISGRRALKSDRIDAGLVGGFLILPKWTGTVTTHNKIDSSKQKGQLFNKVRPMEQAAAQLGTPQFPQMSDEKR
jgi:hypothetical protein